MQQKTIRSEDTDVIVMAIGMSLNIINANVFLHMGPISNCRVIHINKLASELGEDMCQAMIGIHTFTGCDSVSSLKGKGKVKTFNLVKDNKPFQDLFKSIGQSWILDNISLDDLGRFVCCLYGKSQMVHVNAARYEMFRLRFKIDATLPPDKDSLICHLKRASYKAAIHCRITLRPLVQWGMDGKMTKEI